MRCPVLSSTLVIADDAQLAAQVSCLIARPGAYLSVIDGPRLTRPDRNAEVIRRNNVAGRLKPDLILLAGLSEESADAIVNGFTPRLRSKIRRIFAISELNTLIGEKVQSDPPCLLWGRDRIGVGVLRALYSGSRIVFSDVPSPTNYVAPKSDHLVVCEEGNELSQVIAANYAYSLRAGLYMIPEASDQDTERFLEYFYGLYENGRIPPAQALEYLRRSLRERCGPIPFPSLGSVTFICDGLPYGFAFSEAPATHLFTYPDLGIAVINGLAAEQRNARGISVVVSVAPDESDAPEIKDVETLLPPRGALVRSYTGRAANVRAITEMIELFPYDLLVIATHCGDAPGYRWTYEFRDSEGIDRTLVVDIAVGFGLTDDPDVLNVTEFMRFVSLDGVDWNDPNKTDKIYVGRAILEFTERTRPGAQDELKPVKRENISRVPGSAVLKMHDHNYISLPRPIADHGTPIIINNACSSWHNLAKNYTFGNARAYVGTLFPITTSEAHGIIAKLFGKHFGKDLPSALWSAQRELYGDDVRRPYVMTGVYTQRLRCSRHDVPGYIMARLSRALGAWKKHLASAGGGEERNVKSVPEIVQFYERELEGFRNCWQGSG